MITTLFLVIALSACGGSEDSSSDESIEPPVPTNQPPQANAGNNQTVDEQTQVQLLATASDVDGTIVSYAWLQTAGESVSLTNSNINNPTFTAPSLETDQSLSLTFQVTVTDDNGATATDDVTITVNALPPDNTPNNYDLSVSVNGSGTISSQPDGIDCGSDCEASFAEATQVTLTATPAAGFVFESWSGACSGSSTCVVDMTQAQQVSATFSQLTTTGISHPLPQGHFIPARMPMHLVYPRPDSETQIHARHRWIHTQMPYQVPIGVQGGAWPFRYQIISAPAGSTISETYGSQGYGVLQVPAQASGSGTITVRITDQELNTVDATWSYTVDDSKFTFIQDGAAGGGSGTISSPLEDWADFYLGDENDNTYANQILVLREGNYSLVGDTNQNGNVAINFGKKTGSIIGYPGETPVIDCSTAKIFARGGTSADDIFVAGITWQNARTDVNNSHFFWCTDVTNRISFWDNAFSNISSGLSGIDNPTCVFIPSTVSDKNYVLYKGNAHEQINTGASNGSVVDIYFASYVLIEENTVVNSDNGYGLWAKGTISNVTIRANVINEAINQGGISLGLGQEAGQVPSNHEVCWNKVVFTDGSNSRLTLLNAMSNFYETQHSNNYVYRNTFVNGSAWVRFPGTEDYEVAGNIVISDLLSRWNTSIMDESLGSNLTSDISGNDLVDGNRDLTGASRTQYLGTHGHAVFAGE